MKPEKVIELAKQAGIFIEPGLAPTMDTHKQLLDFAQLVRNETLAEPAPVPVAWRGLTDVQWMGIVNLNRAWLGYSVEDAVHEVVKLTEARLKANNTVPVREAAPAPEPSGKLFHAKFNVGEHVWYMKNDKPTEVVISAIEVFFVDTNQDRITYNAKNVTNSISWLDHTKMQEAWLFRTKAELLESL